MVKKWYIILFIFNVLNAQENIYDVNLMPFSTFQYDEICPVYFKNGIVFSSNHAGSFLVNYKTEKGKGFYNILFTNKMDADQWSDPCLWNNAIKTNYHDGPIAYNKDFTKAFITRNNNTPALRISNSTKSNNKLGLFFSELNGSDWASPSAFEYNNESYNIVHASFSPSGDRIYFASDMPGGKGRMDLYYSDFINGKWQAPVNLGEQVNTNGDEIYPFMHSSGKLYFSSNKHFSKGGLDIFYSVIDDNMFTQAINVGEPINTKFDDFAYISEEDNMTGYFSSNRRKRQDDIYSFKFLMPNFESCDSFKLPDLCATFFEEGAGALDTVSMQYEWDLGDGTKIRALEARHCYAKTGTYNVLLNVIDPITNELFFNQANFEFVIEEPMQPLIVGNEIVKPNQLTWYEANTALLSNFKPENYYWVFNDDIVSGLKVNYRFTKSDEYMVKLGIIGKNTLNGNMEKYCTYKLITVTNKKNKPNDN